MKLLLACEESTTVREAFRKKGVDAYSCDLQESRLGADDPYHIQGDVLPVLKQGWDMVISFPTCTYLTVTGNKWFYHPDDRDMPTSERRPHPRFPDRWQQQAEGAEFFMNFVDCAPLWVIENPVGCMSRLYRKPNQIVCPTMFGHKEPKKTCLWTSEGISKLKPTDIVEGEYTVAKSGKRFPTWYHYADKSKGQAERAKKRSTFFQGMADAMADQWSSLLDEPYKWKLES